MDCQIAHDIFSVPRTEDVSLLENVSFQDMFFSDPIYKALSCNGFHKPSPIQYKAIPLARCGFDLIVQSKSGTGKTLVFVTTALENIDPTVKRVQAIVLAPTREIALQIKDVFKAVGSNMKDLAVESFIGGTPLPKDIAAVQNCQIAVGAPGRLRQLVELGHLKTEAVRLLVLDEADQLMANAFQPDINFIYWSLSEFKQTLALSATYPEELVQFLGNYTRAGKLVTPQTDTVPVLKGLKQFVSLTRDHPDSLARLTDKEKRLVSLLSAVKFNQCLIFSNYQSRAESTCNMLRCRGWSCEWMSGKQAQEQRIRALTEVRSGRCRLLVTTDLTARGIDSKGIDLVINMDTPYDPRIYLHRMGRAGRYGSHGVVITILSRGKDVENFRKMLGLIDKSIPVRVIPSGCDVNLWSDSIDNLDEIYGLESTPEAVELYKRQFLPADTTDKSTDKTKKNKKAKVPKNGKDSAKIKPPDLNDENFPAFHEKTDDSKKNTSLNDYFLFQSGEHANIPCLSSLRQSLDVFVLEDGSGDNALFPIQQVEDHSIETNGAEYGNLIGNTILKPEADCYNNSDVISNTMLENKAVKKRKSTEAQSNYSINNFVQQKNERNKIISKTASEPPVRRFSYSDITKGKRVECKPVRLEPEQVAVLKKSPLKLFPSERVTSEIEGVQISDKAIDAFSQRMYSSVLKAAVTPTKSSKANGSDGPIVPDQIGSRSKVSLDFDKISICNGSATSESKNTLEHSRLQVNNSKSSPSKHGPPAREINLGETVSDILQELKPNKGVTVRNPTDTNKKTEQMNVILPACPDISPVIPITCPKFGESVTNGPAFTAADKDDSKPYFSLEEEKAASSPKLNLKVVKESSYYESQSGDLSRISQRGKSSRNKKTFVTLNEWTSSDSSLSEGEYILSGSIADCPSPKPRRVSRSTDNCSSFRLDDWFKLYYHQTSLIYDYVKRAKEFQSSSRFGS